MEEQARSESSRSPLTREAGTQRVPGARTAVMIAVTAGVAGAIGNLTAMFLLPAREPTVVMRSGPIAAMPAVQAPVIAAPEVTGIDASLVVEGPGGPFLILAIEAGDEWADNGGQFVSDDGNTILIQPVKEGVSPALSLYAGKSYEVFGANGVVCSAVGADLVLYSHYVTWEAPADLEEALEHASAPAVAMRLIPTDGNCAGGLWGRDHALRQQKTASVMTTASQPLAEQVMPAFKKLPAYRAIQKRYRGEGNKGNWHEYEGAEPSMYFVNGAEESLVVVSSTVGFCGGFEATLSVVFKVSGDELGLVAEFDVPLRVEAAADVDGDGNLELFVGEDGWDRSLIRSSQSYQRELILAAPIHVCRC